MGSPPLRFVVVAGPTASGKSGVALDLAERFGGEIVNADSRQIYRFMDVGTAKPSPEERRRIPHHLFDVVAPDERFDAARYRDLGRDALADVVGRGAVPIVVGGTGLYLRTLCRGLFAGPPAEPRLRRVLTVLEERGNGTLWRWCRRLDPVAAARLHPNDVVRLVRAIEVALKTGQRLSDFQKRHAFADRPGEFLYLVVDPGRKALDRRIEERAARMFAEGLLEEVRGLWARGYGAELRVMQSIGYREAGAVLRGERTVEEGLGDLVRSTRRFARRQLTWFRSESGALWFHPDDDRARIVAAVEAFLRSL